MLPEWQPIETAPPYPFVQEKWFVSGPRYLLWVPNYCVIGYYGYTERGEGRWHGSGRTIQPTHWMPLPEPPK